MASLEITAGASKWTKLPSHRLWLLQQADALFSFFERESLNPLGGFYELDDQGRPYAAGAIPGKFAGREIHVTTRMVHCFSIAHLLGRPGADTLVDHGMEFLWNGHRDAVDGGYFWGVGYEGPTNDTKQAYGHAFVLLAASSAKVAGHPDADRLLTDISTILSEKFWEEGHGAVAEEFTRDWKPFDSYRGQNSNMHLTEALMAAFEATGDSTYLSMAERIADLIIRRHSAAAGWRLPEHFSADWKVDRDYSGDPMFRPYGTTPGHSLEWARLLLQLWELGGRKLAWLPDAAKNLFGQATADGWDAARGGFYYTLEWDGSARIKDRYWWPCCEAIGAASFLNAIDGDQAYEEWYRRIWSFCASRFVDRTNGGWHAQLDNELKPNAGPFYGKPDIYHALQACLIPLLPTTGSITRGLGTSGIQL
ncbi:AGE family epimerase/isomerase [Aminobacter sp. AP02]|uniref:AGE family epimerase/isomerase n=1 Tax=Aminobacter sp. AP02 TaxID=2135737 RepID=UPI000D6ACE55|nr:AGE family epimerase/isomerase [Aminobacter sp. AP02]PWK76240.1 mannose/cellobiose epimerase-like protein (N-acyl-D-glucosamine 2-epimerase family) [Aminobacter sp. AP02]